MKIFMDKLKAAADLSGRELFKYRKTPCSHGVIFIQLLCKGRLFSAERP